MPATLSLDEADQMAASTQPKTLSLDDADKLAEAPLPAPKPSLTYKTKFNFNPLAGLSREGKMLAGALADIGQGVGDTSKAGEWENLKAATMDEPLPVEQQMKSASPSIRIPYQAAESITQSVPQLAAAGGAGALAAKLGQKPQLLPPRLPPEPFLEPMRKASSIPRTRPLPPRCHSSENMAGKSPVKSRRSSEPRVRQF